MQWITAPHRNSLHGRRSTSRRSRRARTSIESLEPRCLLAGDLLVKVSEDPNANGISDPNEDRLPGWSVYLDNNANSSLDAGEPSLVTDGRGEALFTGLAAGNYRVGEVVPPHWIPTTPTSVSARVRDGRQDNVSFLNFHQIIGDIQGTVWNDLNDDGVRATDPISGAVTDPPLAGRTVFLDLDHNHALNSGEPSRVSDSAGHFAFLGLPGGGYSVVEQLPAGWGAALGFNDTVNVNVTADSVRTADFANVLFTPTTVQGTVWEDLDGNGQRATDPISGTFTDPGLVGWQVYADANGDGVFTAGEPSAITDANGQYTITGVPHGAVSIREVPQGYAITNPVGGAYNITLHNGQTINGLDFGNHEQSDASISGTIYKDANHNGVRDAGEPGLSGITVFLDLNGNGNLDSGEPVSVSAVDQFFTPAIDETGSFTFTHLRRGAYQVREIVPIEQSATPASQRLHTVVLTAGQQLSGADSGNSYRPNEIHGVLFNDANHNHAHDIDELGIGGVSVYIDLNRNDMLDAGEPNTVTDPNGSYVFTGLTPGAYVVRVTVPVGQVQTYPQTPDGILWPAGVSNPSSGNVTPGSITASLADNEHLSQSVSLTLPGSGGVTNLVDVFLLFDDTGSFTANSPIVRAAFPQIIADLQAALPGIDLGFGVGRFEEYGNFASENSTGRPFILNHPIVSAETAGMSTAIQAALDRVAPGFGGDQPETLIEALYQTVTGLGFDGNNDGTVSESGPAGLASTQLTPGDSGDVPAFSSYTTDPANNVLPADGTVGGAGFRPGALPVVLAATDTGFAFQPQGETSISGLNGLTLPLSALTQASRGTTPFDHGTGIQETITGLNALGALVIGLGTNPESNLDPRADLEAIAKLTGAVNNSTSTILNGTSDPVAPGDPFYFQISPDFAGTVSSGVINAIQNAATNVAMNISVRASDPRVHIVNHTGTVNNVGAGDTATFDIEFVGDGRPHRFDLQFVREGTNVVLGSIPVVLGTPIPGDGYSYEELEDGEIEDHVEFGDDDDLTAHLSGATDGYRGESLTFALSATSAVVAPSHSITYDVDWNGDGTIDQSIVGPASGISVTHGFATSAAYHVGLRATEGDNTSPLATRTVNITDYVLRSETANPALTDLIYGGTPGFEGTFFFVGTGSSAVTVFAQFENNAFVNKVTNVTGVTGKVIAYGYDGADALIAEFVTQKRNCPRGN